MILYADDILILSPSVSQLEHLLHACESELAWLNMAINFCKSCCIRVGPRCDKSCANISSKTGSNIPWVTEMRYLGVYFVQSRYLKCSLTVAKRGSIGQPTVYLVKLDAAPLTWKLSCSLFQVNAYRFYFMV